MAEVTDLLQYKRKRQKRNIIRTVLLILLVLAITYGVSYLLYESGAKDTGSFISGMLSYQEGGSGYPANSPGGIIEGMYSIDGHLAVLNDTNLFMYGMKGGMTDSLQHKYQNPILASNGNKVLLYGQGGKGYGVYQKTKLIKESSTEHPIFVGDIAENGRYVLATKGDAVQTRAIVYSEDGEEMFEWRSPDKYPTTVSLSDNAALLAVGAVSSTGGKLVSTVTLLSTTKKDAMGTVTLEDELVLSVEHMEENVRIVTDKRMMICDNKGTPLHTYMIEGQPLSGFNAGDDASALLLGNYQNNRSYTLVVLDSQLKETGSATVTDKVYSIQSDRYGVYLLMGDRLKVFDLKAKLKKEVQMEEVQQIFPMGHYVYTVTPTHIYQMDFNK